MLGPFTPPAGTSVVHELTANLDAHSGLTVLCLTQYDQTIPILAVRLFTNSGEWPVPEGCDANIRMRKPDGKHVYDPALGISEDRKTVYIAVTAQMTAAAGRGEAILEITRVEDDKAGIIGSSSFTLDIARNPVPADAYESTDEFKTLQEILAEVQKLEKQAAESARQAKEYAAKPPIIRQNEAGDYTWWTWDADEGGYVDSFAPAPATTNRYAPLDAKAAGWQEQEDGSYEQMFEVKGVTAETEISADFYALVDPGLTLDEKADISAALGCISEIVTQEGQIRLVCFSSAPEMDLNIVVQEVR